MLADRPLELVGIWMEISSALRSIAEGETKKQANGPEMVESDSRTIQVFDQGTWIPAPSVDRATMQLGDRFVGPILIRSVGSTTMIDRGWEGQVGQDGILFIRSEWASIRWGERDRASIDGEWLEKAGTAWSEVYDRSNFERGHRAAGCGDCSPDGNRSRADCIECECQAAARL